ncbi:MAG: GHMP kinase [Thaumarchaeota archaeon]|nr:GHMP kinase [Nitrososphaerota archaeon]
MRGAAFCPAHVTGFFGVEESGSAADTGSVGAGFSIQRGVTTTVEDAGHDAVRPGMAQYVLEEFRRATGVSTPVHMSHEMGVPAGYGLGSSGALALSALYALDTALGTRMPKESLAMMAHISEVRLRTGLGDVLAAYHGGFEIRVRPGGPGRGIIRRLEAGDPAVVVACLSPLSTSDFLRDRMGILNGMGGRMVAELDRHPDMGTFQRLSMEFARKAGTITPQMESGASALERAGYPCGVAMLGGTIFSMVPQDDAGGVMEALRPYDPVLTGIDHEGARAI